MRPFIPDTKNPLPDNWRSVLRAWVSGTEVSKIGAGNMKVVEDAFMYRLVWALEAVRTRRQTLGWSADIVAGGGAAALETGVPQLMMSMLIRAGLPSRRAAMAAVESAQPSYTTPAEMRAWLESNEITAVTDEGNWPTPETAALWARFRREALSGGMGKWRIQTFDRLLDIPSSAPPHPGLYRVLANGDQHRTWLATPDYQMIAPFSKDVSDPQPSLVSARLAGGTRIARASRIGPASARWPRADRS
jgi:hypothetical protein